MTVKRSSTHVRAANFRGPLTSEGASDEDLIRGFTLSLGASGRAEKTLAIYEKSVLALSGFARSLGMPGLVELDHGGAGFREGLGLLIENSGQVLNNVSQR